MKVTFIYTYLSPNGRYALERTKEEGAKYKVKHKAPLSFEIIYQYEILGLVVVGKDPKSAVAAGTTLAAVLACSTAATASGNSRRDRSTGTASCVYS
jgi:hypothetical protein